MKCGFFHFGDNVKMIREYNWMHADGVLCKKRGHRGGVRRGKSATWEKLTRLEFLELLNSWNRQYPGHWVYWSKE